MNLLRSSSRSVVRYVVRHHVALLALFVAMSGVAYASSLPRNSVSSKHIKNGQVKRQDIGTSAVTSARIANGSVGPTKLGTIPAASLGTATPTTISDSNTLSFGTEQFDTAGLHNNTNPTRLTAPIAGIYVVNALATWDATTDGYRQVNVEINGTGNRLATDLLAADSADAADAYVYQNATAVVSLNAGDYLEMIANETAAGNATLFSGATDFTTFAMTWVGPAS